MEMKEQDKVAALFDFDGTIVDSERYYTQFWGHVGEDYFGDRSFAAKVKGETLVSILTKYFPESEDKKRICENLDAFEAAMRFDYIAGFETFVGELRRHGVRTAIVTSSAPPKMELVYKQLPELKELFDVVVTAGMCAKSKPEPDCFLRAMELLGVTPEQSFVFEDSINGLKAGRRSGATVIGLTTTVAADVVKQMADKAIGDYEGFGWVDMLNSRFAKKEQAD